MKSLEEQFAVEKFGTVGRQLDTTGMVLKICADLRNKLIMIGRSKLC